jgi:hypothetical protein
MKAGVKFFGKLHATRFQWPSCDYEEKNDERNSI